ncbi:MarR family transcriptional regulator [uncultured Tateyamaria sp.]|uniref:MarR family winged helix-turn-helix transcriptional regulator n=1 Tax=uncultured Tateyamaria sp. TaxID=455651 RepID=UPI00262242FA|nr:MarR family transcriptional regulator [uncultured Tateyamaria sp.]
MIDKKDDDFLGQNIKGLMMTLLAQWNQQMDDARAETEFATVRPADIRVFAQLRGRTIKLSDIHREMGFSRQAAQQAVDRLVAQGMLSVDPVPGSKRDKVVSITDKGQRWRTIAAHQIRGIEEEIADVLGEDGREVMRQCLVELLSKTSP